MNVSSLAPQDLDWADMVWVGGMTVQRKSAEEIISRCRAAGLKVVVGGPLFTAEWKEFDQKAESVKRYRLRR